MCKQAGALFFLALFISAGAASQKYKRDSIPESVGYVNDFENIFSKKEEKYLDSMIRAFEKKTSIQIALVTIDTSMVSRSKLENYVFRIATTWGVGQKKENNGVTIGISKGYRYMRIENGYGIEGVLSDTETKKIIDSAFIPSFKKEQYFEGVINGLKALMAKLDK